MRHLGSAIDYLNLFFIDDLSPPMDPLQLLFVLIKTSNIIARESSMLIIVAQLLITQVSCETFKKY